MIWRRRRRRRRIRRRKETHPSQQWRFNATISISRRRRARASVYGAKPILRVAYANAPQSADLGRILSMTPALQFRAVLTPITSAVSAWFGSASKDHAGDDITTQLGSIAR
jgi:hypothetical protein